MTSANRKPELERRGAELVVLLQRRKGRLQSWLMELGGTWRPHLYGGLSRPYIRTAHVEVTSDAVAVVGSYLTHSEREVRLAAAGALTRSGERTVEMSAALTDALKDDFVPVRINAARAVQQLEAATPELVAALRGALLDPVREVRWQAAQALSRLAPSPASDWVMAEWLACPHSDGTVAELKTLGIIAPERAAGYRAVVERGGPDAPHAAELLGRSLAAPDPEVVKLLETRLAETGAPGFASALGRMGLPGDEALLRQLEAPLGHVRRAAVWGLRVRRSGPPELLAHLHGDADLGVQIEIAALFAEQGLLPLASLTRWADAQTEATLAELLRECHRLDGHVKAVLTHLADSPDRHVRAQALTRIDALKWALHASK